MKTRLCGLLLICLMLLGIAAFASCGALTVKPEEEKTMVSFVAGGEVIDQREWDNPDLLLALPEKNGYTFEGWYLDDGVWEQAFNSETISQMTAEEDFSVYAKLVPVEYNITYVLDAEITNSNPATYTIEDAVTLADLVLTGYTFDGWYDGETKVTEIPAGSTGNRTLTAKFTAAAYTITYELDSDVTAPEGNPAAYDINTETITLEAPTREGYIFEGWYNGETKVTEIPAGSTGDITLTAKWRYSTVTFKFNANGGVGTMSDKTYEDGAKINLPLNAFTKVNCVFAGWLGSDGKTYSDAQELVIATSDVEQLTLTAQWKSALGFDISEWQDGINFDDLEAENPGFIILRAAAYAYREDYCFEEFYAEAKKRNIPVGVYFYSYAYDAASGREEAEYLYDLIKGKTFEYPIFMDVESSTCSSAGSENLTAGIEAFCDYLLERGYYAGVYTYASFMQYMDMDKINAKYDVWLAAYVGSTSSEDKTWLSSNYPYMTYTMYQWTDAYSSSAPVDANWTYKDYEAFIKRFGFNGFEKTDTSAVYKSYTDLAQEVLDGKWGADEARKIALTAAGYDYQGVQEAVNWLVYQ